MRPSNGLAMVPFYTKYVLKSGKEGNTLILGVMLLSAVFWWPLLRKNAGIQLVRSACLSDVIDEDELRTGVRREGAYWNNDILRAFDVYSPRSSFHILV